MGRCWTIISLSGIRVIITYIGSASLEHSHDFEHSHAHYDAGMYGSLATAWDGSTSAGMIFFAPNDATGSGAADLAIPPVTQPLLFRGDGDSMLRPAIYGDAVPSGALIPPPERPPLA